MHRIALGLILALLAGTHATAWSQERKLPLVDEAASDATWQRFKKQLLDAVQKRDKQFLLSILDKKVRNQTKDGRGVAQFRKEWELDTADSPVWRELATALQLGSAYMKRDNGQRELCTPYLLARWPPDVQPFENGVVIARDAAVQAEPSSASASIGTLSYDIVPVTDWEMDDKAADVKQKWVKIRYRNRDGFVPEEQIRSPIEPAACFVRSGSGWRMTAFAPAGGA